MNYEQNALVFRNRYSKVFLLILLFILPRLSYTQETATDSVTTHINKNAIKGMPIILPFVGVDVYAGLSVGYDRYISKHHVLELCSYYYFNMDEMGAKSHSFSIMPGYKYSFVSQNIMLNNSWAGVYLSYYQRIQTTYDGGDGQDDGNSNNRQYYYGLGLSVGKKIYLNKTKRLFLDIGFGLAFNKWLDEPIFSASQWDDKYINNTILPRLVVQFGWKF